ncbi:MAG TPA: YceH family protein [Pyrinomonadaceae bacterium]|jgi:uncharacterized protein YceH (UPF0502 family)|nr:YceH family protein [Pyrinomonadaceae bacterium]
MLTILSNVETRVLGSLIEKQITTPEYYPLTLNALTLACNQKNNRNPVTAYDEQTVADAVESLRIKNLAYVFYGSNSRVPKYKHVVPEIFHLSHPELSLLCLLMLRGPQTPGELHSRAGRMFDFRGLEDVESTINSLINKDPDPMVVRLARQPGQKETRFAQLLNGEVQVDAIPESAASREVSGKPATGERISQLESEVERLSGEVRSLQEQFVEFKKQFE